MRKYAAVLLGLMAWCVGVCPATADLRFSAETAGEIRYVFVEGEFEITDDLTAFSRIVREHNPEFVTFSSPGGNVAKAMELGHLIRGAQLFTLQIRGVECASACAFAFFGGVSRIAMPGAIGMHKISVKDSPSPRGDVVRDVQDMTALIMAYMRSMGVDPALLELTLGYDTDDMRYLSGEEMARYHVTSSEESVADSATLPAPRSSEASRRPPAPDTSIPTAVTGSVRHPNGRVGLKAHADEKAAELALLPNGTRLEIISDAKRWYRVKTAGRTGFLHHSWVRVDQFVQSDFEGRYIQVKSFRSFAPARDYVLSSSLPLAALLATNGWYAITLDGTLDLTTARRMLRNMKADGVVPSDAYITYGNTYVRKVCCN